MRNLWLCESCEMRDSGILTRPCEYIWPSRVSNDYSSTNIEKPFSPADKSDLPGNQAKTSSKITTASDCPAPAETGI